MMYEGKVLDGPWEGRVVGKNDPYFYVNEVPRLSVLSYDLSPPAVVSYNRFVYQWMRSYRAWVWRQDIR